MIYIPGMVNNKAYCCSLPLSKEDMIGLVCDYIILCII